MNKDLFFSEVAVVDELNPSKLDMRVGKIVEVKAVSEDQYIQRPQIFYYFSYRTHSNEETFLKIFLKKCFLGIGCGKQITND